ncbi:hypothetical protein [Arthrobacter sp. 24S4-2]|uniref:hypothetical protein n=1 Tax=Arthrobacter sp. 24S4-2 TaxID=2575374 RepID=UPI0020C7949A|nr:hypothetical protein [Arthrobacter sp. 24S4-2]
MEAVGELAPNQAKRLGECSDARLVPEPLRRTLRAVPPASCFGGRPECDGGQPAVGSDGDGASDLARSLELLRSLSSTVVAEAALLDFREAADFAANVEEVSRTVEYLQVVAAGAVDRSRRQATAAARAGSGAAVGWVTGWGETAVREPVGWVTGSASQTDSGPGDSQTGQPGSSPEASDPAASGGPGSGGQRRAGIRPAGSCG